MNNDIKYYVGISLFAKIRPQTFFILKKHFNSLENLWQADIQELIKAGLREKTAQEFVLKRQNIDLALEMQKLNTENIKVLTYDDNLFPQILKETHSSPFILYYKGNPELLHSQNIAIVGTRQFSNYGKIVTDQIVGELIQQNICIVSGLALGIDSVAHAKAIDLSGNTIAVLGSGLDQKNLYPATNRALAKNIVDRGGLVISEFPIGTMPLRHHFPQRNRIIAGLSLGTVVIEAAEVSGALITAKFALEQNREVFAVPGPITYPKSVGTNNLIKQGAKLVTCAQDILEELNIKQLQLFQNNKETFSDSAEEATILKHLSNEPKHINELIKLTEMTINEINSTLIMMEMKGQVKNLGNMTYIKNTLM